MDTKLVKTGELSDYVDELLLHNRSIIESCEKILPHVTISTISRPIEKQLKRAKELVEALERGYVPVPDVWGYHRVDTKNKWSQRAVKQTLASMPDEIKAVWEKVKAEGFFDSFSVTVRGGGDPVLVGNKGRNRFLIGAWIHLAPGFNVGFAVRR